MDRALSSHRLPVVPARYLVCTVALIGLSAVALVAQSPDPVRKILVIHNASGHMPARELFDRGLLDAIRASSSSAVDFYMEYCGSDALSE